MPVSRELFSKYIASVTIVIVDQVAGSRFRIIKALIELGAKKTNIGVASTHQQAFAEIKRLKPKLVISDYTLDNNQSGLDLLNTQRSLYPKGPANQDFVFLLLTANTSQSAVAEAAEEDVDDFILKPYTTESFKNSVVAATLQKIFPDPYMKKIETGKAALASGELSKALESFDQAKTLSPKPSLAYFYRGQIELLQDSLLKAQEDFKKGLTHGNFHHKCMTGLYELLVRRDRIDDAYFVLKRLARFYPANSKRLMSVLRMAVNTANFEDVQDFHEVFKEHGDQSDLLVRYFCSALVVSGKHYLRSDNKNRALEHFDKVAETCRERHRYLRFSIEAMVEFKLFNEAEKYLEKFPMKARHSEDYKAMDALLSESRF